MAIAAIMVVIPLVSVVVFSTTSSNQQFTNIDDDDDSKLEIISSFNPLYEFSQIVGQDKVDVDLLVPSGVEPHDWEPTVKDVQQMQKSDLIVINGIGFENWVDDLVDTGYRGTIIDTSKGIVTAPADENDDHGHSEGDPHIWLNPVYAKKQVENIAVAFSAADPDNANFYHANAIQYGEKLDSLDSKIRSELSTCNNNDFIAFHDAFSYFSKEYGLNQHTILSANDLHGEITAKTLEKVISKARELNIKVIFSEESVNTKTSQIIANEIGGKVMVLSPIEIVSEGDYISKMSQNLENLKEALC